MKPLTIGHVLLTRFSYRMNVDGPGNRAGNDGIVNSDPLDPSRLNFRFALFESACLPNVLAQTNQNFDWILIIDPDLPMEYRRRLRSLIAKRKRSHLHVYSASDNLARLAWLERYMSRGCDLILTTNLDDDDILSVDFVEKLQSHVLELGDKVPSIKFLGVKQTYEWDLYSSSKYPFGTWAPWHRFNWFRSTGLTLLCRAAVHQLSVFTLHHSHADVWYAQGSDQQQARIAREVWGLSAGDRFPFRAHLISNFQQELEKGVDLGGDDWKTLSSVELHYDLSLDGVFAGHLNHFMNDQSTRMFEHKPGTLPVVDVQFFPEDFRIDWGAFQKHRDLFKLSWRQYRKYLPEIRKYQKRLSLNWWQSILLFVSWNSRLAWWFLRH
ncbi:glycosyltransferase [Microbulbifer taiwanensis]